MSWVNDWIGIPYKANGRNKDGFDCYGLVKDIYKERLGLNIPDWQSEDGSINAQREAVRIGAKAIHDNEYAVEVEYPEDYDFILAYNTTHCNHVGLYYKGNILHVNQHTNGVTYERIDDFKRLNGKVMYLRWH